jgi:hypothetical protein
MRCDALRRNNTQGDPTMNRNRQLRTLAGLAFALALVLPLILSAAPAQAQEGVDANAVMWNGVIDSIAPDQWLIAGQAVAISPRTIIRTTGTPAAGMWAEVQAARDGDTLTARRITVTPPEMRLRGEISFIPEGRIGTWIVGGQPFEVTADTAISDRGGPVVVGAWAQVIALEQGGALVAQRIRGIDPLPAVEVLGVIQAFDSAQWTLSGIDLAIDDETLLNGEPRVGLLAIAAAELQADNSLLALRVRVFWHEPGGPQPPVTLTGVIEQMPPNGLVGRWIVAGTNVVVSRNTLINQSAGAAVVGAEIQVSGHQADGGAVVAREIVVLNSPVSGEPVRFQGRIRGLPENGLLGVWTIGDRQVQVTENTRIDGERFVRIGARVQVWGLLQPDGEIVGAHLIVHPWRPGEESIDETVGTTTN